MTGFTSDKIQREWSRAAVALRLVVEALAQEWGGVTLLFRLDAPTKFENGVHATGLAADVELHGATEEEMQRVCIAINERFVVKGPGIQVATLKKNLANFPSGRRSDRPHVHVQIPFDWKADPRRFLREHGYTEGQADDR